MSRNDFKILWGIATLKKAPFELKYSWFNAGVIVLLIVILQWGVAFKTSNGDTQSIWMLLVLSLLILRSIPMIITNNRSRWLQTISALFGADLIVLLPLVITFLVIDHSKGNAVAQMIFHISLSWQLIVAAHIYRFSLNVSLVKGFLWAIGVAFCHIILSQVFIVLWEFVV